MNDSASSSPPALPGVDPQGKLAELRYQAQLDGWKADRKALIDKRLKAVDRRNAEQIAKVNADIALEKASWDSEWKFHEAFHAALVDVAKGSIDRNAEAAKFVETAASAIAVIYTGILTFSFVATGGKLLPSEGIIPGVFLALAIGLAAGYLGFIGDPGKTIGPQATSSVREYQWRRTNAFIRWIKKTSYSRASLLRAAVISLGVGALALPVPYLQFDQKWVVWTLAGVSVVAILAYGLLVGDEESTPDSAARGG